MKRLNSLKTKVDRNIGAGGYKTNKNGLIYEELTELNSEYKILSSDKHSKNICFSSSNKILKTTKQSNLFKCMIDNMDKKINKAHGCKNPDECFIDERNKRIFILEKKFQQVSGSVCEKIQTPDFKVWQYTRTFPKYKIVYMYCLSKWFKIHCKAELEYLKFKKIPVFWGCSKNYKKEISNFILNYK